MKKLFASIKDLKISVAAARADGIKEAHNDFGRRGYFPSRGTWLCTADANGQCWPAPEADCHTWDGTMKEIDALIANVVAKHPHVTTIYIGGGYDYAESMNAYRDGDYAPQAGMWSVDVWVRDEEAYEALQAKYAAYKSERVSAAQQEADYAGRHGL